MLRANFGTESTDITNFHLDFAQAEITFLDRKQPHRTSG